MSDPIETHELLTEHVPAAETHHLACGAPWMPQHTVDAEGVQTVRLVCPACNASHN